MSVRDLILSRLPEPGNTSLPGAYKWPDDPGTSVVEAFKSSFCALGGVIVGWETLKELQNSSWCIDPGLELPTEFDLKRATPWDADFGLTRATLGIAESGSILLEQGAAESRLASLAPPVHVALLAESSIVWSLSHAFDRLSSTNATIVTGPSRTADIEGVLVRGVHGPKAVWVLIEPDRQST